MNVAETAKEASTATRPRRAMNLLLGSAGRRAEGDTALARFTQHAARTYTGDIARHHCGDTCLAVVSSGGVLSGHAASGGVEVFLHGYLHAPLPGWRAEGSPLDDPNAAAAYLRARYAAEGERFLEGVWGRYCVVVVDAPAQRTLLAGDAYGHGQIFWHLRERQLRFATHLRSLAVALGDETCLERGHEDFLLTYGFTPPPETLYRGVSLLPPGTLLVFSDGEVVRHAVRTVSPWKARLPNLTTAADSGDATDHDAVVDTLHECFMGALQDQLASDSKVAVLLGGFDSALVAAGLARLGKQVETFSFRYADRRYNQPETDTLSDFLGTKHHWVDIPAEVVGAGLRDYADVFSTPTNWANYVIQSEYVCRQIRDRGFRYCYTGDGCDGLFQGYPGTYKRLRAIDRLGTWPTWLVNALVAVLARPALERVLGRPHTVALSLVRAAGRKHPERNYLTFPILDRSALPELRAERGPPQRMDPDALSAALAAPHADLDPVRLGYLGKNVLVAGKIKLRGCADSSGMVVASPYQHAGMVEFAKRIPNHLLRPPSATQDIGKYVLSRMAHDKRLLPDSVIFQPKLSATAAPLERWFAGPLRPVAEQLIEQLPFRTRRRYVDAMLRHKWSERVYKRLMYSDPVTLSHGVSLLTTYASLASER